MTGHLEFALKFLKIKQERNKNLEKYRSLLKLGWGMMILFSLTCVQIVLLKFFQNLISKLFLDVLVLVILSILHWSQALKLNSFH